MKSASSLQRLVALKDRPLIPDASRPTLSPVCVQIEAIRQVRCFNRVIVLTPITPALFFLKSMLVGVDAMLRGDMS